MMCQNILIIVWLCFTCSLLQLGVFMQLVDSCFVAVMIGNLVKIEKNNKY